MQTQPPLYKPLLLVSMIICSTHIAQPFPMLSNAERRIKEHLFGRNFKGAYDKTTRPVKRMESVIKVGVGISLFHILETVSCVKAGAQGVWCLRSLFF